MQLISSWYEVDDSKSDFRKELRRCTLRLTRSSKNSTTWMIEITVGEQMVGIMRQIFEADSLEDAFKTSDVISRCKFEILEQYYNTLIKEISESMGWDV